MAHRFPEVQSGGSLIVAWQIRGKKVVVVGGGEVFAFLPLLSAVAFFSLWPKLCAAADTTRLLLGASSTASMRMPL